MSSDIGSIRSSSTVLAEGVFQGIQGAIYGAIWGLVTPFHVPGSFGAITEAKTGLFQAARPFSSITAVGCNAAIFGGIMGVQSLSSKALELARRRDDFFNNLFGLGVTYKYYTFFLGSSDKRLITHNRIIGAGAVISILYGHLIV